MEEEWVRRIRSIDNRQQASIVDATIDKDNHLILKRLDRSHVDAGLIKGKPLGTLAYVMYARPGISPHDEPDIYITKDGIVWHPAASEGKFGSGTNYTVDGGCWTGDRFLVSVVNATAGVSTLLQSRDGGTWAFHPDSKTFNVDSGGNIHAMMASGTGVVIAGGRYFGQLEDSNFAISRDFGETWTSIPVNDISNPFDPTGYVYGLCVKNDWEWVGYDGLNVYYTYDSGGHWVPVILPAGFVLSHDYSSGMRFFDGYWWFYGRGDNVVGSQWDTPLIKSKDLSTWEPVVTPWSGAYPPLQIYAPSPASSVAGWIINLMHDPLTNAIIANGRSGVTSSYFLMSTDGGKNWFEIGFKKDDSFRASFNFEGVYNWPDNILTDNIGGIQYGYGWWFVANARGTIDINSPPLFRISPDGEVTEPVYLSQENSGWGLVILRGGDVTV